MFTWAEVGMFFAGYLFGFLYFYRVIIDGRKAADERKKMIEAFIYGQSQMRIFKK